MNTQHTELLQRLNQYSLDTAGAALPFSERLARDNQWDLTYARRVVVEYERFAFLAVAAGHPVTPSDQVDQAWHLHLLYTESYWSDFCPLILGQPLHHGPTKGGRAERNKFANWYDATLVSYRQFFQQEPPSDIWSDAAIRFGENVHFARVNTKRNWIIPKPRIWLAELKLRLRRDRHLPLANQAWPGTLPLPQAQVWLLCLLAWLFAGCQLQGAALLLPHLPGTDFLQLYCVAFAIMTLLSYLLRLRMREPSSSALEPTAPQLDPYATAYLAGGASMTVDAVVANLAHTQTIAVTGSGKTLTVQKPLPAEAPILEQFAHNQLVRAGGPVTVPELRQSLSAALLPIRQTLQEAGYLVAERRNLSGLWWPALIALIVPVLGIVRIIQGIYRDRPVGYLVALVILSLVIVMSLLVRRLHRTSSGDQVLARLKNDNALLKANPFAFGASLPLAVALFGLGVLAQTSLASLQDSLHPHRNSGGCGSGDGGASSGGCGSGCGGGGCGGCGGS